MIEGNHYFGWGSTLMFMAVGIIFLAIPILAGKLIRPDNPTPNKSLSYECGEMPIGDSWLRFNPRYYVIALIFVLFDVEIIFMYPWAVAFGSMKHVQHGREEASGVGQALLDQFPTPEAAIQLALAEMLVFVGILVVGFVYLWRYGYLDWIRGVTPVEGRRTSGA